MSLNIPDEQLVEPLKKKAKAAVEIRKALEIAWKRNLFFMHNRLDYKYDKKSSAWRVVRTTRDFIPVNLMVKIYQTKIAKLLGIPTSFVTEAGSNQKSDEVAAKYALKLAKALVTPLIEAKREEDYFWGVWVNKPLWKIRYDKDSGEKRYKDIYTSEPLNEFGQENLVIPQMDKDENLIMGEDGKPKQAIDEKGLPIFHLLREGKPQYETIIDGHLRLSILSPFEYVIDPLARGDDVFNPDSENRARWVRQNKIVDKEYLIQKYGKNALKEVVYTKRVAISGVEEDIWRLKNLPTEIETVETTELFEHWELPSDKYPDGLLITYLDTGQVLQKEGLPEPFKRLNRLCFLDSPAEISIPYRYYGETIMEKVAPLQRDFSQWASQMSELRKKIGDMEVWVPGGGNVRRINIEGEEKHRNIFRYDALQQPNIQRNDTFPMTLIREGDRILMNFEMVSGQSEMKYPMKEKTATEIIQTLEQDETRLASYKKKLLKLYADIAKISLEVIREYYTDGRKIKIVGDYGQVETIEFNKADLQGNYDIFIQAAPLYMSSRFGQLAMIKELVGLGVIKDPQQVLNFMNMRVSIESTEEQLDEKRATKENLLAKQGKDIPPPLEIDIHSIHLPNHRSFVKSEEESLDSLAILRITGHIKAHEKLQQGKALEMMALQQMAQQQLNPPKTSPGEPEPEGVV